MVVLVGDMFNVAFGAQKARSAGLFKNVKGRGQPLARSSEESNPFIAREEYLMNRIVQRNGAAPPWVEVQSGKTHRFNLVSSSNQIPRARHCRQDIP